MKNPLIAFFAGLVMMMIAAPVAAEPLDAAVAGRIDAYFNSQVDSQAPGRAVAIIRNGELVMSRGYGRAQLEYDVPVSGRTVFHVASLSKQFTAFAVLLLVKDGKIDLDADVRTYVPWVPDFGRPITVRQLVHHTSGLRDSWPQLKLAGWKDGDVVTDDDLRWLLRNQTALNFVPGEQHLYSNLGYFLLAEVVARASDMRFADYLRTRIFEPLGMTRTHVHDDPNLVVPNRAYSYERAPDGRYRNALLNYATVGATGLFTTAEDLALWLDNFRTARVGGSELIRQMQETGVLNNGTRTNYAFGIQVVDFGGMHFLTHGGLDAGFRSHLAWIPAQNVGIIVLSNSAESVPANDIVMIAQTLAGAPPAPPPPVSAPADTKAIAGDYLNSAGMKFTVRPDGVLLFKGREWPLTKISETEFVAAPANVQLKLDPEGMTFIYVGYPLQARRIEGLERPGAGALAEYAGLYFAPDIQTYYQLVPGDGRLLLRNGRLGEIPMDRFKKDMFVTEALGQLRFVRDKAGTPTGFSIPTEMVGPGMVFQKVR